MTAHRSGSDSCREVFARLSEYLDAEIEPALCEHIEEHLSDCPPCVAFLESLRRTVAHVGSLEPPALDEASRRRLVQELHRMRDRLDD